MFWWRQRKLLKKIDRKQIEQAIADAERQTSGEICVSVAPLFWGNLQRAAEKAFVRLGLTATKERNGVLLFIVPSRRRFAVIGDTGIHEKVGQEFWDRVTAAMAEKFRAGQFTEGLLHGINEAAEQLRTHFPYNRATDTNELPNKIDFG